MIALIDGLADEWKDIPMLARTRATGFSHTFGKELKSFYVQII